MGQNGPPTFISQLKIKHMTTLDTIIRATQLTLALGVYAVAPLIILNSILPGKRKLFK